VIDEVESGRCSVMSGDYASGMWFVKAGSEDAFVERWRAWLTVSSAGIDGFEGRASAP
jgi:hypothetical protein